MPINIKFISIALFFTLTAALNVQAKCWPSNKMPPTVCALIKVKEIQNKKTCIVIADIVGFDIIDAHLQTLDKDFLHNRVNVKIQLDSGCDEKNAQSMVLLQMNCNDRMLSKQEFINYSELSRTESSKKCRK